MHFSTADESASSTSAAGVFSRDLGGQELTKVPSKIPTNREGSIPCNGVSDLANSILTRQHAPMASYSWLDFWGLLLVRH